MNRSRFEQEAQAPRRTMVREWTDFLVENRNWWLAPIVLVLALLGVLTAFTGTGVAPFIYTMF